MNSNLISKIVAIATITEREFDEICEVAWQSGDAKYQDDGIQGFCELPQLLGHGGSRWISLHQGQLEVVVSDNVIDRSLTVNTIHEGWDTLVAKFFLQGYQRTQAPNVQGVCDDYLEVSGQSYLFYLPDVNEIEHSPAQRCQVIKLHFHLDLLRQFSNSFEEIPQPLKAILDGITTTQFHQPLGYITPAIQTALQQILHCPFTGAIAQLYLESKAIELLALQLAQWSELKEPPISQYRSSDIDKLHQARAIITNQIDNPPSLLTLARQVGLSDRKLKQGFQQVFGTTVFGYLHHHRLERAHDLLREDLLSISEIAYAVGFSNRGCFAAAFCKKFGMNPRDFRRSQQAQFRSKLHR